MNGSRRALPRIAAGLGAATALAGLAWLAATRTPPAAVPRSTATPAVADAPGSRGPLASRRALPADPSDAVLLVVGATFQPVANATAQPVERGCPALLPGTERAWHADAAGELRIPAAAAQDAAARQHAFAVHAPDHAPALVDDVRAGATTRVVLQPGHAVRLRAIDALDRPVAAIRVALVGSALTQREGRALTAETVLVRTTAAPRPVVTGVTDEAGEAVLRGIPSGRYQVRADTAGTPYLLDAEVRRQVVQVPSAPVWFRLIEPVAFAIKPEHDEIRLFRYLEHDQRRWISGSNNYAEQLRGKELELAARHPEHAIAVRLPRAEGLDDPSATVAIASLEHGWHVLRTRFVPLSRLAPEALPAPSWPPVPWGSVQVELRDANDRVLPAEHALGLLVTEPVPLRSNCISAKADGCASRPGPTRCTARRSSRRHGSRRRARGSAAARTSRCACACRSRS
jgi:hypothetical protein